MLSWAGTRTCSLIPQPHQPLCVQCVVRRVCTRHGPVGLRGAGDQPSTLVILPAQATHAPTDDLGWHLHMQPDPAAAPTTVRTMRGETCLHAPRSCRTAGSRRSAVNT